MLRYLTAGESHGPALTAVVEGFPSGIQLDTAFIDRELSGARGDMAAASGRRWRPIGSSWNRAFFMV